MPIEGGEGSYSYLCWVHGLLIVPQTEDTRELLQFEIVVVACSFFFQDLVPLSFKRSRRVPSVELFSTVSLGLK